MKLRQILFDDYYVGIVCALLICLAPLVSIILGFINYQNGYLPHIMAIVANLSILYEFRRNKRERLNKRLKIEKLLIVLSSAVFLFLTFVLMIIDPNHNWSWLDYSITGYCLTPLVITVIETILAFREYYREYYEDNEDNNDSDNSTKIATGVAINV